MKYPKDLRFMHLRFPEVGHYTQLPVEGTIAPRGGATVAMIQDGDKYLAAISYCNPTDNYNYTYGRNKAYGRLIQLGAFRDYEDGHKYFVGTTEEVGTIGEFADRIGAALCEANGYVRRVRAKA